MRHWPRGFTLVELLVVIALVAILSALATPGFRALRVNLRLAAATRDFVAALNLARTEALKRSQTVMVVPTGRDWHEGWRVQLHQGSDTVVLRRFEATRAGIVVDALGNAFERAVAYDANGFAGGSKGINALGCLTFKAETGRRGAIVIPASGRPKRCDPDQPGDCGSGRCGSAR